MITEERLKEAQDKAFEDYRKKKQIRPHLVDAARTDYEAGWSAGFRFLFRELVEDAIDKA